jgi:hypothetical protein
VADRDQGTDALREALKTFAGERAAELVGEARAEAEARVRAALTDAYAEALLDRARAELGAKSPARRKPRESRATAVPEAGPERPVQPARTSDQTSAEADELGYYVYGVGRAGEERFPEQLPGVDPAHAASMIEHRGLAAISSRVPMAEFAEEPLHENLNDVDWLEEKARAHERVLDEAMSLMPVVPMRLCTIYRSEDQVREMLEREYAVFVDALGRLQGKTEWGVKLIAEPGALVREAERSEGEGESGGAEESAGAAYMRKKRREAHLREAVDRIAESWAHDVHERLADRADEALLNPLQNPEVSGHTGDMLLNGVYLVDDRTMDAFSGAIEVLKERYAKLGARVELTGPWPPYNFVKGSIEAAR